MVSSPATPVGQPPKATLPEAAYSADRNSHPGPSVSASESTVIVAACSDPAASAPVTAMVNGAILGLID